MRRGLTYTLLILFIMGLFLIPAFSTGCASVPQRGNVMFFNGKIPPIDQEIHEKIELATFSLG